MHHVGAYHYLFKVTPTWLAILINAEINRPNQYLYSIKLVNMSNSTRLYVKTDIMDHAIFCRIHLAPCRLRQYLRHAHKKVPLICEKHLPTKYSGYATAL